MPGGHVLFLCEGCSKGPSTKRLGPNFPTASQSGRSKSRSENICCINKTGTRTVLHIKIFNIFFFMLDSWHVDLHIM